MSAIFVSHPLLKSLSSEAEAGRNNILSIHLASQRKQLLTITALAVYVFRTVITVKLKLYNQSGQFNLIPHNVWS